MLSGQRSFTTIRRTRIYSIKNARAARTPGANALELFKHTYSALPEDVLNATKLFYEDLSKDALLERCVGGFTQNNNESMNQLTWKILPKHLSGTSVIVEIAAYVAASVFSEGSFALLTFMQDMEISSGFSSELSAHNWARLTDTIRISQAEQEAKRKTKEGSIRRIQKQKGTLDIMDDRSNKNMDDRIRCVSTSNKITVDPKSRYSKIFIQMEDYSKVTSRQ